MDLEFLFDHGLPINVQIVDETGTDTTASHEVHFKGRDGNIRWDGTWGKINIPKQNARFIQKTYYMKVKKGTYEFFKGVNFTGQKATIQPNDTWPTNDFAIGEIRSWRGV